MRLPPLNALRAFEAAARHEGFIGAAEELHVTRGAVSRHVKILEEHLGVALFRRHARGVELTEAGRRLLPALTEAFRQIGETAARVASDASELRIICPPATSIRWLLPRLADFRARNPGIRVRLTTDFHGDIGFDGAEYDLGFSVTQWPERAVDIMVEPLFPVRLTPACAPSLIETARLERPEDLARVTLLHETVAHTDWRAWLEAFSVPQVDPARGDNFANLDMAARAAVMGLGVVMADLALCRDDLESGALVTPFPEMTCASPLGAVCLIGRQERWEAPKVLAFRDWASRRAAEEPARL